MSRFNRARPLLRSARAVCKGRNYASSSLSSIRLPADTRVYRISEEVRAAIHGNRPLVALETTIYTHGWSYPDNIELSNELENVVRRHGAVPATIGILNGQAVIGLTGDEMNELLQKREGLSKVSIRDLPFVTGLGKSGGTTIAGTLALARSAGIGVFATGGLGGVHRGGHISMDVSADLTAFNKHKVALVSSGCKGFLDIPRTLEYLETMGVPVATFADGRTGNVDFPAFWSRDSGVKSPQTLGSTEDAAKVFIAQSLLEPTTEGMIFANPIPAKAEIPKEEMTGMIELAIAAAEKSGASGSDNTPFVLKQLNDLSGGRTKTSNRALIESNVIRGTRLALDIHRLRTEGWDAASESQPDRPHPSHSVVAPFATGNNPDPSEPEDLQHKFSKHEKYNLMTTKPTLISIGSLAIDTSCNTLPTTPTQTAPDLSTSNPASITQSPGGVGRNLALAAHYAGATVQFISAVGDDHAGSAVVSMLSTTGLPTSSVSKLPFPARTPQYVAINTTDKNLHLGMADFELLESDAASKAILSAATSAIQNLSLTKSSIIELSQTQSREQAQRKPYILLDANLPIPLLTSLLHLSAQHKLNTAYEPVSNAKSTRLFAASASLLSPSPTPDPSSSSSNSNKSSKSIKSYHQLRHKIRPPKLIDISSPNIHELRSLHSYASNNSLFTRHDWWDTINNFNLSPSGSRSKFVHACGAELTDEGVPQMCIRLLPFIPNLLVKLGKRGVLVVMLLRKGDERLASEAPYILSRNDEGDEDDSPDVDNDKNAARGEEEGIGGIYMRLFPPPTPSRTPLTTEQIKSVNGAGDTFFGAVIGRLSSCDSSVGVQELVDYGQRCALETLMSEESVSMAVKEVEL